MNIKKLEVNKKKTCFNGIKYNVLNFCILSASVIVHAKTEAISYTNAAYHIQHTFCCGHSEHD